MTAALASAMACVAALAAALAGFGALSLAMDRHHEDARGRGSTPTASLRRRLRLAGAMGLAWSLAAAMAAYGGAQGAVAWFGVLTAAGFVVVLMLTYAPTRVMRLAQGAAAALLVCSLAVFVLRAIGHVGM